MSDKKSKTSTTATPTAANDAPESLVTLEEMYAEKFHARLRRKLKKPFHQYKVLYDGIVVAYVGTHAGAPINLLEHDYGDAVEADIVAGVNAQHATNQATGSRSRIVGRPADPAALRNLLKQRGIATGETAE